MRVSLTKVDMNIAVGSLADILESLETKIRSKETATVEELTFLENFDTVLHGLQILAKSRVLD